MTMRAFVNRNIQRHGVRYGLVVLAALLIVLALDQVTNELDTARYYWDFALYYDMAEEGLIDNELIAPFAYRFVTPMLARGLTDLFGFDTAILVSGSAEGAHFVATTFDGFRMIAIMGAVAQLVTAFWLAEVFGARFWGALVAAGAVALSLYNVRFLLFDVSRPDHLAYPLMTIAVVALLRRNWAVCLIVSGFGLQVREFLIIPPLIMLAGLAWTFIRTRSREALVWALIMVAVTGACVIVPRVLLHVEISGQFVDPINKPETLSNLINAPRTKDRDINIAFNAFSYGLPIWLLLTPVRFLHAWTALRDRWLFLVLYGTLVFVLTMYGGTDIWRFISYLSVPMVMVLAVLLRNTDAPVHPLEIVYMLAAVAVYNRLFEMIPNLHGPYLDFYGGYDTRVNANTYGRLHLWGTLIAGAVVLRAGLTLVPAIVRSRQSAS
ncbi:MAG: hypothetical protein JW966_09885 [Anaerolineae bacterium]|nr:hypothetical protein [Anaerolineae bacterium]